MVTEGQLRQWLQDWQEGRSKNDIERTEFDDPSSHGKKISKLWRERLGVETEASHRMVTENRRLRQKLVSFGIDPDGD